MRNCIENDITYIKDLFIDGVFITVEQLRARVCPCPGLVLQHNVLLNTLRPRQNGHRFADDTFKRIFLNENVIISIKISMKFVPKVSINNIPALVQIMAWRRLGDKPLFEPMMVGLLTHICVTRPQCVNDISQRCREQAEIWVNPDIDQPLVIPKLGGLRISHLETAAIRKCLVLLRHRNLCCVNFMQRKFPGLHIDDDVFETSFQVTKETRLCCNSKLYITSVPQIYCFRKWVWGRTNMYIFFLHMSSCATIVGICPKPHASDRVWNWPWWRTKLFGIRHLGPKRITNPLNHYLLIAKMCISKYKYGAHHDLISLFKYEMQ